MWDSAESFELLNIRECSLLDFLFLGLCFAMDSQLSSPSTVRNKSFRSLLTQVTQVFSFSFVKICILPHGILRGFSSWHPSAATGTNTKSQTEPTLVPLHLFFFSVCGSLSFFFFFIYFY